MSHPFNFQAAAAGFATLATVAVLSGINLMAFQSHEVAAAQVQAASSTRLVVIEAKRLPRS